MGNNPNHNFMKQLGFLILLTLLSAPVFAQSTNESFPTPLLQNEISGKILARDIGDSRLTSHFYTFFADNGDVNLALETENFDGDIDLFEAVTLRPLVKITVAAEAAPSQTSRVVYFRKREQVVLRIEGRSLTNDPAAYRISFSGSFAAASGLPAQSADEPKVAEKSNPNAVARVNSAGAIIEVLEPPKPAVKPATAKTDNEKIPTVAARRPRNPSKPAVRVKPVNKTSPASSENPSEITEDRSSAKTNETAAVKKPAARTPKPKVPATVAHPANSGKVTAARKTAAKKPVTQKPNEVASAQPDPLASVQLVILLKNGQRVERVMSEVFNVSVDKGQVTVITKTGKIERYNLLDVQKMTIE